MTMVLFVIDKFIHYTHGAGCLILGLYLTTSGLGEASFGYLMCNFYPQIMVFPGYLLFLLIVCKLFSL